MSLLGQGLPSDYVGSTSGVPNIADHLLHRASRQPWANKRHLNFFFDLLPRLERLIFQRIEVKKEGA
jgi:hypothetical protein